MFILQDLEYPRRDKFLKVYVRECLTLTELSERGHTLNVGCSFLYDGMLGLKEEDKTKQSKLNIWIICPLLSDSVYSTWRTPAIITTLP